MVNKLLAQRPTSLGNLEGIGKLGLEGGGASNASQIFADIISGVIGILTFTAAIWFLIRIFVGGYHFLVAGGESGKVKEAMETIRNALTGLIITVAAVALLSLLGEILHVEFLNVVETINRLSP